MFQKQKNNLLDKIETFDQTTYKPEIFQWNSSI